MIANTDMRDTRADNFIDCIREYYKSIIVEDEIVIRVGSLIT